MTREAGQRRWPGRFRLRRPVHSLAVPYALDALDALDPRELRRFERHLARCARCLAETKEMGEGAARLAGATATAPPPALRDRVLDAVRTTEQEPPQRAPVTPSAPPRPRAPAPPRTRALLVPVAVFTALALAASAILAVQLVRTDDRLDRERAEAREIAHVLAAPDARTPARAVSGTRGGAASTSSRPSPGGAPW